MLPEWLLKRILMFQSELSDLFIQNRKPTRTHRNGLRHIPEINPGFPTVSLLNTFQRAQVNNGGAVNANEAIS